MKTVHRPGVARRSVLLGVPAVVAAATLAPRTAQAQTAKSPKRVLECAADLLQAS